MSNPYLGEIRIVGFNFAPQNWALCDGSLLAIAQNNALFNLIGTTYGGDGQSNFALPDLRGRVAIHEGQGTSAYTLGEKGGQETVQVTLAQMPAHSHSVKVANPASGANPAGVYPAVTSQPVYGPVLDSKLNFGAIGPAGAGQAHANHQPYLTVNYIISLAGIYPSPN